MALLKLNDDILLQIYDDVEILDLVNFALTNHRIHDLGYKRLREHRELVNKYTVVCINAADACGHKRGCNFKARHLVDLLIAIADRPVIASYIRSVTFYKQFDHDAVDNLRVNAAQKFKAHDLLERLEDKARVHGDTWLRDAFQRDRVSFADSLWLLVIHLTELRHMELDSAKTAMMTLACQNPVHDHPIDTCSNRAARDVDHLELSINIDYPPYCEPLARYIQASRDTLTVRVSRWSEPLDPFFDDIDLDCVRARHLRVLPGLCEPIWLAYMFTRTRDLETVRYRPAEGWWSTQGFYDDLKEDKYGNMKKAHMVAELVGEYPDQEILITKRDDLDWGDDASTQANTDQDTAGANTDVEKAQPEVTPEATETHETGGSAQDTSEQPQEPTDAES